jgi:hypothetical protein
MKASVYQQQHTQGLRQQLGELVRPLLRELDERLDKRLRFLHFYAAHRIPNVSTM